MSFDTLIMDKDIIKAVEAMHYDQATPIQEKVIPVILNKQDCIIRSKTGSGKTAAFALPILQEIEINERFPQVLVLAPTRELALQIKETFDALGVYKKIKTLAVFGKQPFKFQKEDLQQRCHVVIGTPGRVLDHLEQGSLCTDKITYLVLDEADEMLNMNFLEDIQKIVAYLPKERITCLCSATMPESIQELSDFLLRNPVFVEQKNHIKSQVIEKFYRTEEKLSVLYQLLSIHLPESCMIFVNTRDEVDHLEEELKKENVSVAKIHGQMMQEDRLKRMKDFKRGRYRILIATDVAARGIDVQDVDMIINYDVPNTSQIYTHRIGRTARLDKTGLAITLVSSSQQYKLDEIKESLNLSIEYENVDVSNKPDLSKLKDSTRKNEDVLKALRKDIMKLYFNGGKNKKIRAKDLVGAILQIEGVDFDDIGVIQVQDHQSYVDILNGKGAIVLNAMQTMTIKNKKLKVQKARS